MPQSKSRIFLDAIAGPPLGRESGVYVLQAVQHARALAIMCGAAEDEVGLVLNRWAAVSGT